MSSLLRLALVLTTLAIVCRPVTTRATVIEGVTFAPRHETHGTILDLRCVGLLRWMYLIKGYVAALYLDPQIEPEHVLSDVPKRLEINYFHTIAARDFTTATDLTIAANTDAATLVRLRPRIDTLNALYRDVDPGDRYALTYVPGRGSELAFNGRALGTIPGADFARAMFAVWLGPKPLDESLKSQLLSCS